MLKPLTLLGLSWLWLTGLTAFAQAPVIPPGEKEPLLRLEAGGPTAFVTALAFSQDGTRLYAAGWDKVVRVWRLDAQGSFVADREAYRVPLGPGLSGAINAIALSDDGTWLAAAGVGVFRGEAGFRQPGLVLPSLGALTPEMRQDQGMIYVFNTRTQAVHLLRGHLGEVLSMTFAPDRQGKRLMLVSAGREWDKDAGKFVGSVRLWDVERETYLDGLWGLPETKLRPGMSCWHTGDDSKQMRVAVAWDDGFLRVWDVDKSDDRLWKMKDVKYNITAAFVPGLDKLLTAGYGSGKAELKLWKAPAGEAPQADAPQQEQAQKIDAFPRALALAAANADSKFDHAAAVVRMPNRQDEYRLQLLDLDPAALGVVKADAVLWKGSPRQPVLAAAPRGRHLAVAGNADHEIIIYSIRDLLNRAGQPQKLRSTGATMRSASFVAQGKELGLLLNETTSKIPGTSPRAPAAGDLIFDFAKRQLTAEQQGWTIFAPALGNWRAATEAGNARPTVAIYEGQRLVRRIELTERQVISDFALLPPQAPLPVPILALAYHEDGQPMLWLYNAASGEKLRQYTGHTDRIYCLAFSADGRLLVSSAEDQTICVWSMTNLGKLLGQLGLLSGVVVKEANGVLVVAQIQGDSPSSGKLAKDEVIEGSVEGTKLRSLRQARDFYEAVAGVKPGKTITLRVRGPGGARDVTLAVSQGIDDRKPLLSLFVTRDGKAEDRKWVGWNPIGPYESSDQKAERHLGWHFNTGEAKAPTRFALADQYRKQYYREGILKDLVARGELQRVPPPPPPTPPRLGLLIEEDGQFAERDEQGEIFVRHASVTLKLAVMGRPLDTLRSVSWKLDGVAEEKLDLAKAVAGEFSVPITLKRGLHKLRVTVVTPDGGQHEYSEELVLRYQPPPPRVNRVGPTRVVVNDSNFLFDASVLADSVGEDFKVQIRHAHGDKTLFDDSKIHSAGQNQPVAIKKQLRLQPGNNLVELVAVNQNALHPFEEEETRRIALEITLVNKARPPLIVLDGVTPGEHAADQRIAIEPGRPALVRVPRIRISGRIEAAEELIKAEWVKLGSSTASPLPIQDSDKRKATIGTEVTLEPGAQKLRFLARTATSDEAEREVALFYQPLTPTVTLVAPAALQFGEKESGELSLQGRLRLPADRRPFRALVFVNDKELPAPPAIDERAETLSAKVPLQPGDNKIQVRLNNTWEGSSVSNMISVRYARPPRIVEMLAPPESSKPFAEITAHVRSPLALLQASMRVEVNGHQRTVQAISEPQQEAGMWLVKLQDVPLDPDGRESEIRFWVSNQEAECLEPGKAAISYKRTLPPPEILFLEPRENVVVRGLKLKVRFRVLSANALKSVRLIREGDKPISIDVAGLQPDVDGQCRLTAEQEISLEPDINHVRVEATSAGGQQTSTLIVNFPYKPVRLVVDSILPMEPGAAPVQPRLLPGGKSIFAELKHGRARLQGRVLWDEADDQRLNKTRTVRVYVNGFQQIPALLQLPGENGRSRAFEANIVLNQAEGNRIELALPDLAEEADDCSQCLVNCIEPEREQRLHLLVVSLEAQDKQLLKADFLRAFQSSVGAQGQLKTPVFEPVYVYGPQVGDSTRPEYVYTQIAKIQSRIRHLNNAGLVSNDVVVFFYQGTEAVGAQGNLFLTSVRSAATELPYSSIACDDLVHYFADTPGAHVLMFDVGRQAQTTAPAAKDKVAGWEDNYPDAKLDMAIVRYAWLRSAHVPKRGQLIDALEKVMPHAARLSEVTEQLRGSVVGSTGYLDVLQKEYIPEEMKSLVFSRKR